LSNGIASLHMIYLLSLHFVNIERKNLTAVVNQTVNMPDALLDQLPLQKAH
jgi:hypothetical protein